MTNEEFEFERANMSNEKLLEEAQKQLSKMCKTYGKSFTMCIPPRLDDTDIIFQELIDRYKGAIKAISESNT